MAQAIAPPAPSGMRSYRWLAAPLLAFALVSLTAGILARHQPRSKGYFRLFFSDPVHLKAGFATAAVILACFQLFTAGLQGQADPGADSRRRSVRRLVDQRSPDAPPEPRLVSPGA